MLFLVFVVSPFVRKLSVRDQLFQEVGRRFSLFGTFGALSMLAITGLFNVHYLLGLSNLADFSSPYTKTLLHKIAVFVLVVFVSLTHDLYFGPRAVSSSVHRFLARLLGLLNLFLSLLIVYLAVKLRFGG
ncbi:MAG: CopD family protein [Aquificaceae bacterium]|nr:CopD family protein [Aquificaceae bacterium]